MDKQENQRQGFRINDRVALLVRRIKNEELQQLNTCFESRRRELAQAPDSDPIADYKKFSLAQVQKRCPEAYAYIDYLEEKLKKLERSQRACESVLPILPSDLVNISASGIQFQSEEQWVENDMLEIALRLFPSLAALLCFAKVTRCEAIADAQLRGWTIGATFTHIDARDQELLAGHIHRYQIDALSLLVD
jgi:hypothetical protein